MKKFLIIFVVIVVVIASVGTAFVIKENRKISRIYVSSPPIKVSYAVGESFEAEGLIVHAQQNNGDTYVLSIEALHIFGFENTVAQEDLRIKVVYKEFSTSFFISIIEPIKEQARIENIEIESKTNDRYPLGTKLGIICSNMNLLVQYDDGTQTKLLLNPVYVTNFDQDIVDEEQTITIRYYDQHYGIWHDVTHTIELYSDD